MTFCCMVLLFHSVKSHIFAGNSGDLLPKAAFFYRETSDQPAKRSLTGVILWFYGYLSTQFTAMKHA